MARTFITLAFVAAAFTATAQDRQVKVVDSPEMMSVVEKRTALVNKTADLTEAQTAQVKEVYLKVERQFAAINARYAMADPPMAAADREHDMKPQYEHWDKWTNEQLSHILSEEQMTKWLAAQK